MAQEMFGPYRLDELLGRGGMGEVYRAYHTGQDRTVALKLLIDGLGTDEEYRKRFLRESRVTARLTDPHVIPIHGWGEIDGRLYLDMRYVRGEDLAERLRRAGPLSPPRAVAVVSQVARALDAAHRSGLVHRDVKPSNILLSAGDDADDDDDEFAYLVDFGIARSLAGDTAAGLTRAGNAVGTLDYMSPERFLDEPVDGRADVYALAGVLHECLTGERPFPVEGLPALMNAHLTRSPPRPSAARTGPPPAFDEVVARGMAKDPALRHPTAGALAGAARRALRTADPAGSAPAGRAGTRVTATSPPPATRGAHPAAGAGPSSGRPAGPSRTSPVPGPGRAPLRTGGPGHPPGSAVSGPPGPPGSAVSGAGRPGPPAPPVRVRRSRRLVVGGGVAVAVAAVSITGVLLANRGPGGAAPAATTAPPAAEAPTPAQRELLAVLPIGFGPVNCSGVPEREDAEVVAAVECGGGPPDGPGTAVFLRYRDAAALDTGLRELAADRELAAGDVTTCRDGAAVTGPWSRAGVGSGRMACYGDPDTGSTIEWTDPRVLARGIVTRFDADAAALYDWWAVNDFI